MMGRLPVAPRPYRDELLSSWLGRVACRYGLDAEGLVGALFADGEGDAHTTLIDDAAPPREDIAFWAQACGVDPARLLALDARAATSRACKGLVLERGPALGADGCADRRRSVAAASRPIATPDATTICGRIGCWRSAASAPRIASCCGIAVRAATPGFASPSACATGAPGWFAGGAVRSFLCRRRRRERTARSSTR